MAPATPSSTSLKHRQRRRTLADELSEIANPAPRDIDPEAIDDDEGALRVGDDEYEDDHYEAVGESALSKHAANAHAMASNICEDNPVYAGKKASRRDLGYENEEEEYDSSLAATDDYNSDDISDDDDDASDDDDDDISDDDEFSGAGLADAARLTKQLGAELKKINAEGEAMQTYSTSSNDESLKGEHARKQVKMSDQFLELRIRLQKTMAVANRMPHHDKLPLFLERDSQSTLTKKTCTLQSSVFATVNKFISLQEQLLDASMSAYPEGSNDVPLEKSRKRKRDAVTVEEAWDHISGLWTRAEPWQNFVLEKWHSKTMLSSGKASLHSKEFKAINQGFSRQVDMAMLDVDRVTRRTQLKRTEYRVFGEPESGQFAKSFSAPGIKSGTPAAAAAAAEAKAKEAKDENYDEEIFDDGDFYHLLLRDLIERRSDPNNPNSGNDWAKLQASRAKKKKVDTRASKGRKIRYDVHEKLASFMFPQARGDTPDEARDKLFASLFRHVPTSEATIIR